MAKKKYITASGEEFEKVLKNKGHMVESGNLWKRDGIIFDVSLNEPNKPFNGGHRKRILDEMQVDKVKNMVADGISKAEIARMFKCSESTIRLEIKGEEAREKHNNRERER